MRVGASCWPMNERLASMLGYAAGELLGKTIEEITHPSSREESARKLTCLRSGGPGYVIEKEYVRKDGSSMWGVTNVTAVRPASGEPDSFLAFVLDVTAHGAARRLEGRARPGADGAGHARRLPRHSSTCSRRSITASSAAPAAWGSGSLSCVGSRRCTVVACEPKAKGRVVVVASSFACRSCWGRTKN
jgi:PAS domain S-box-containing protein